MAARKAATKKTKDDGGQDCPKCGSDMKFKTGGMYKPFWGCSNYPRCKGTRPASPADLERHGLLKEVVVAVAATRPTYTPSDEQATILRSKARVRMVIAGAGCAKTSTMTFISWKRFDEFEKQSVGAYAFNKKIARELESRLGPSTQSSTTNSYGDKLVRCMHTGKAPHFDSNKIQNILVRLLGIPAYDRYASPVEKEDRQTKLIIATIIEKFVNFCRGDGLFPEEVSQSLIDEKQQIHGLEIPQNLYKSQVTALVREVMTIANNTATYDYLDQLWLPTLHARLVLERGHKSYYTFPTHDLVMGDEAQDWNRCQHYLMLIAAGYLYEDTSKRGEIVFVGDPLQSIYAFRGADFYSMDNFRKLIESFGESVEQLPLMTSFRLGKRVTKMANQIAPDLKCRDDAPDGDIRIINELPYAEIISRPADWMISCRTNAPLISLAYEFIKRRVPVRLNGKEFGESLVTMIIQSRAKSTDTLVTWISTRISHEKEKEQPNTMLLDQYDCLKTFCEECDTIEDILRTIQALFNGDEVGVMLSSIHQVKGLEALNVVCYPPHPPHKMARTELAQKQENHLWYVQVTRTLADGTLYIMPDPGVPYAFDTNF